MTGTFFENILKIDEGEIYEGTHIGQSAEHDRGIAEV